MNSCANTEAIAKHCSNEGEVFCSVCGENMYIKEDDSTIVVCANEDCDHELDMQPDEC